MNFLLKYWTRILLITLVLTAIAITNSSFNKEYISKRNTAADITKLSEVEVRVDSFVLKHKSREIFEADIVAASKKALEGLKIKVYLKSNEPYNLAPGDILVLNGRWSSPKERSNDGSFDGESYYKSLGIHGVFYADDKSQKLSDGDNSFMRSLSVYRNTFMDKCDKLLNPRYSGIVKGLVSGETKFIDDIWKDILKKSGIYHIIAISGMHLNVFIICIAYLISKLKLKRYLKAFVSAIACISVSVAVLMFTGAGLSLMRAFVMLIVMLGAPLVARKYNAKNSLAVSAAVILILTPESMYNSGFQLSLLSTYAVLVSSDIIKRMKAYRRFDSFSSKPWFATLLTSVLCAVFNFPIMFASFGYISLYAPITNLIVLPMSTPMLALGVIFALLSIAGLDMLARLLTYPIYALIYLTMEAARIMVEIPYSVINLYPKMTFAIVCIMAALILCIMLYTKRKKLTSAALLLVFCLIFSSAIIYVKNDDTGKLTFADVGQGDCTIVSLPESKDIMIDCGSTNATSYLTDEIKMTLIKNDIHTLDAMIISHYDSDHVATAIDLLAAGLCDKLYLPKYYDTADASDSKNYRILKGACDISNTDIHYLEKGDSLCFGDARLKVLSPHSDTENDSNEMSMVVKLSYGDTEALFTGDIRDSAIEDLINEDLKCDILKLPHHGGKNKLSSSLIQKSNPKYALISCGVGNWYRHPHDDTLDTLNKYNIDIYRTDYMGAVSFFFDKDGVKKVETMK